MQRTILTIVGVFAMGLANTAQIHAAKTDLLNLSPNVVVAPSTALGATSPAVLSVLNYSTADVTLTSFTISGQNPLDFSVSPGNCPLSPNVLYQNFVCNPNISFTPTAIGIRTATLVIKDAGGAPQMVVLTGQAVTATKAIEFSVPEVAFPGTPLGLPLQNAPQGYVILYSIGTVPLNLQSVNVTGPNAGDFHITSNYCLPGPIPPSGCSLYIAFLPTATGIRRALLTVTDDGPGGAQSLPLVGIGGVPENLIQLSPVAITFAPTGTADSEVSQLTVQNSGSTPVTISGVVLSGPNASDFSLVQNNCEPIPYTLPVAANCNLEVQFTPGALGMRVADLKLMDSATASPQVVPLQGFGVRSNFNLSFAPNPYDIGVTTVGTPYFPNETFALTNQGNENVQLFLQLQGMDAPDFSLYSNTCSGTLSPGGQCYVTILFTPSATGVRTAILTATDTITGQSRSAVLAGGGEPVGASLTAYVLSFSPTVVGTTSQYQNIAIANTTSSTVTLTGIDLAGAAASDFSILNSCTPVLPVNNTCTLEVTFTPTAVGPRIATLIVTYGGGPSPLVIPLAGMGEPTTRTIGFNSASLGLGSQPLGFSVSGSVTVTNTGTSPVSITGMSLAGSDPQDYAITGNQCPQAPATLLPTANCQVTVQFTPSRLGSRIARLVLTDDATGSPQSVALIGSGNSNAPALEITANSIGILGGVLNFYPEPLGSSTQQSVGLGAYPGAPVDLTGLQVVGPDASDFSMTNNCPLVLTGSCQVNITFTPSVTGFRVAELQVHDNAIGNPQVVPLDGIGLAVVQSKSVSLSPNPLAFNPAQAIGYTGMASFSVQNTGTESVLLTGFRIGGQNGSDFGIQSNTCPLSPASLPAGQFCQVTIEFTPARAGVRMATFTVADNATGSPQSISLIGQGLPVVKTLQIAPSTLTFPPTPVGTTDYAGSVDVYNSGTVTISPINGSISGPNAGDFTFTYTPLCGLSPGTYCNIFVDFTPSAVGTRTATLKIVSSATGSPQTVQLTGTGQ